VAGDVSSVQRSISRGAMPRWPQSFTLAEKNSVLSWLNNGHPESSSQSPVYPPSTPVYPPNSGGNTSPVPTTDNGDTAPIDQSTMHANSDCAPTQTTGNGLIPTYNGGVRSIMLYNCTGCHTQYATLQGVKNDYQNIMSAVNSGSMPRSGKLSDSLIKILQQWGTDLNSPYGKFAP